MDVHFLDATNDAINLFNDRALPVLKAVTGQDLGVEPEKWKNLVDRPARLHYESDDARDQADVYRLHRRGRPGPVVRPSACFAPGPWFKRSTARGRSSRSGRRCRSCRRGRQPVCSHFNRWWPSITISPPPRSESKIGGETIVATGIHRFWKAGKGWTMARRAQGRRPVADGRRHGRDRSDRGRQDAARL